MSLRKQKPEIELKKYLNENKGRGQGDAEGAVQAVPGLRRKGAPVA